MSTFELQAGIDKAIDTVITKDFNFSDGGEYFFLVCFKLDHNILRVVNVAVLLTRQRDGSGRRQAGQ